MSKVSSYGQSRDLLVARGPLGYSGGPFPGLNESKPLLLSLYLVLLPTSLFIIVKDVIPKVLL